MSSPNLERALRIKTNSVRGGLIEHIYMRDITIGQVSDAVIRVNFLYEEGDAGPFQPTVRHIEVRDVTCDKGDYALYLRGYADSPISDIHLIDCTFQGIANENILEHVEELAFDRVSVNGAALG
jgi:polygalacturonase